MTVGKLWAIEYSVSQRCFHIEQLEDYVVNNIYDITQNLSSDYRLIGLCLTYEGTRDFIELFQMRYGLPIKSGRKATEESTK